MAERYNEIKKLHKFCERKGVDCSLERMLDGYAIRFKNGADVVQHYGSYGALLGMVEFGSTGYEDVDFRAMSLEDAKKFISKNVDWLNRDKGVPND